MSMTHEDLIGSQVIVLLVVSERINEKEEILRITTDYGHHPSSILHHHSSQKNKSHISVRHCIIWEKSSGVTTQVMVKVQGEYSLRARGKKMKASSHEKLVLLFLLISTCIEMVSSFMSPTTLIRVGCECRRYHLKTPTSFMSASLSVQGDEENGVSTAPDDSASKNPNIKPWMKCINGIAPKTGALNEVVSKLANVSLEQASQLITIGAVWAKMDVLTEEEIIEQYYDDSASASAKLSYSDLDKGWHSDRSMKSAKGGEDDIDEFIARMESRRYNRVMSPSIISQGTDLRIYPFPRRFPSCSELNESRLLYEDTTFVIVDKPPLLPTQPDASNYFENCPGCTGLNLGPFTTLAGESIERPLLCHRVDSVVGGCVVMSKDANGQAVFSRFQRDRKVKKVYLAVTKKPVPLGMHVHWIWAESNKRGGSGGPPCQLVSHEVPLNRKKAKVMFSSIFDISRKFHLSSH